MSESINSEFDETIADICRRQGLEITGVEQQGTVIILHPRPENSLPKAEALRKLADQIGGNEIRYVTLALDDFDNRSDSQESADE